jgi:hypothetical protein
MVVEYHFVAFLGMIPCGLTGLPALWMNILPLSLLLPWRWRQYVLKSWWPLITIHSVIIQKTTIWTKHLLLSLVFDIWTDILEFINDIFTCITSVASNDRLQLIVFCDTSDSICIFPLQNLQTRNVVFTASFNTHPYTVKVTFCKLQCRVKQHELE